MAHHPTSLGPAFALALSAGSREHVSPLSSCCTLVFHAQ